MPALSSVVKYRLAYGLSAVVCLGAAVAARQTDEPTTPAPRQDPAAQSAEFFEARVRPVLAANCYDCHADAETGGLRVDSLARLLAGGDSGPAIVPGDPDGSLLVRAIRHADGAPKMPNGAPKLRDSDIDAIVQWIQAGAVWPDGPAAAPVASHEREVTAEDRAFWAFQPLSRPAPPAVGNASWAATDIDRFVLAQLEAAGLTPVAPADKRTLIRRATLDLTGLPPTPEEIDAFLADERPDAFAVVVDRLLASPRYGETWGRLWLDIARYGEDDYRSLDPQGRGYNPYPNAYLYRDWVIRALNADMPYDEFVTAQLAADLMDQTTRVSNLPALGFLGLGPWYYDNGAVEITRADERHDRVDAVSRGLLGVTVGCARCHDHKYDPITAKDYYSLAGVFLNTEYHEYPLAPKAVVEDYKARAKQLETKQDLLSDFLSTEANQLAETLVFQISKYMQAAWKVTGEPRADKIQVVNAEKLDYELFDRYLAFLAKPPVFYPYLTDWQAMIGRGGTEAEASKLADAFQALVVDVMLERRALDEENDIIRAQALPSTKPRERANKPNEFKTNDDFCPGCALELRSMEASRTALWTDVFRSNQDPDNDPSKPSRPGLLRFSGWGLERQLGPDRQTLIQGLRDDIKAMQAALPTEYAYVHGVRDVEEPADLKVHLRGNPHRLGDEVARGFPTVLSPGSRQAFTSGSGRRELAEAIVSHPIAMRVIVNRVWKGHFGTGLVDTPSNLGKNGERPSHPELLEYLASTFIDDGMSLKALHRRIMLSATYQLSAAANADNFAVDSGNRLYWRANIRRLNAEEIRDSVLFVSGALDLTIGGPSEPLTPLYDRRTVYGRVSRYRLDEFLQLFDFPSPSQSAEKRFSTNVPLQRLFFMNSDFMQQHAEKLAVKVAARPDDAARIREVYRVLFGREATAEELTLGLEFLRTEPMRMYEDARAEEARKKAEAAETAATADTPDMRRTAEVTPPNPAAADGMMAGVVPGAGTEADKAKMLPVTVFGRYIKTLLSSNEFLFVN